MAAIKESLELLSLIPAVAGVVKQAKADGKLNYLDALYLKDLVEPIRLAADGADKCAEELKDLSLAEAVQLVEAAVQGVKAMAEALMEA